MCVCVCVCVCVLSHVRLFATPWTVVCQASLSMGFSRQECWRGLPFLTPGDLADPGFKPMPPALEGGCFSPVPSGKPIENIDCESKLCISGGEKVERAFFPFSPIPTVKSETGVSVWSCWTEDFHLQTSCLDFLPCFLCVCSAHELKFPSLYCNTFFLLSCLFKFKSCWFRSSGSWLILMLTLASF